MPGFDLSAVQAALVQFGLDGWLLYEFRGTNPLARRVLHLDDSAMGSRRCVYWIPAAGRPRRLVHRIEDGVLDHLPGDKTIYLRWQEFEAGLRECVRGAKTVAMEFSPLGGNPYVARVDAGTVDLIRSCGVEVVSSGDLIQLFEAVWDDGQWEQHRRAERVTTAAYDVAWRRIAQRIREHDGIEEVEVQQAIMDHFAAHRTTTYHPPIVARGPHSGMPHYETGTGTDTRIRRGDLVLVDLWAKLDEPRSVYSDLTRMGFAGETVPERYSEIFRIVAAARDAGIARVRAAFSRQLPLRGGEVDDVVRGVIEQAGYGAAFVHRTGHNIGQEVHGNGAHIDNLETREDRRLLPRTCFSIEPGIYLPEFGVRSEINVFIDAGGEVHVTGGPVQTEIVPILKDFS